MSRLPRRPLARRLTALAVGTSLLAAAAVAATAGRASADTVINAHYAVTGTTFIKKLNTTVNLGSGTLAATVDLTTGASSSTLTLPPATASVRELGVIPVARRNTVVKWLGGRNPTAREMAAIDAPSAARSSMAWSRRRPTTKW